MYDVVKCSAFWRMRLASQDYTHIYTIPQQNGLYVCLYMGKRTLCSPERCTSWNATSAQFLEVQIPPHVLVYD